MFHGLPVGSRMTNTDKYKNVDDKMNYMNTLRSADET